MALHGNSISLSFLVLDQVDLLLETCFCKLGAWETLRGPLINLGWLSGGPGISGVYKGWRRVAFYLFVLSSC